MPDDYYVSQYSGEEIDERLTSAHNAVRYDAAQTLTDTQKTQARENIGAAPAGYGLGESNGQALSNVSLNSLINNGWYFLYRNNTDGPDNVNISDAILFVSSARSDLTKVQRLILGTQGMQGYELRRVYNNVSWQPWEWVNPPMTLGVEFRTTERYLWKPVYCRLIDFGSLPNATSKMVYFNNKSSNIISAVGITSYKVLLLGTGENEHRATLKVKSHMVSIETINDQTQYTATILVKYYKDTD